MYQWQIGIQNEIKNLEGDHRRYGFMIKNFIFECLNDQMRKACEDTLKPEDSTNMNSKEYMEALRRQLDLTNSKQTNIYKFKTKRQGTQQNIEDYHTN